MAPAPTDVLIVLDDDRLFVISVVLKIGSAIRLGNRVDVRGDMSDLGRQIGEAYVTHVCRTLEKARREDERLKRGGSMAENTIRH